MSTEAPSRTAALPPRPTLADLATWIAGDETLSPKQRQDIVSALRTMARALKRRPEEIPAHPWYLKERLGKLNAAAVGLSEGSWANILSRTRGALKRAGLAFVPGRYREPLAPAWEDLYRYLNDQGLRTALSKFARYCTVNGISPADVTDAVVTRFVDEVENSSLSDRPRKNHRALCKAWNAAAGMIACWPQVQLSVPDYRKHYFVPWSEFPESLKKDIDAYLHRQASEDLLSDFELKPLRPRSVKTRLRQFHQFASALVRRGYERASLRSIADLVQPQAVNDGLQFYLDRPEGKKAVKHAFDIAGMLKSAAKHWVGADDAQLRKLQVICKKLKPARQARMTPTNLARVRPLSDPKVRREFLNVAETMIAKLPKIGKPLRRDALLVQSALAIQMLQMFTPRLSNLVNLHLERNIIRSRSGIIHLVVEAEETKNDVAIEKEFPEPTARLLDLYLERYRPVLLDTPSEYLFPGKNGRPKSDQQLRNQVMKNVKRYCGLTLNPHAYRHAGAKLFLRENPGQYGVMKLVLSHKSVTTTEKYYCDIETEAASELFDRTILKLRDQPVPSKTAKGGGK
jgi:integrase